MSVACACRSPLSFLLAATLAITGLGLSGLSAFAHDTEIAIAAEKLKLRTDGAKRERRLRFRASGQEAINIDHDPRVDTSWILVRGYGENGGTSGRIELNPKKWKRLKGKRGYKYRDPAGKRGGVQKVLLQSGKLSITAGGRNWEFAPEGPQDSVWVHFGLEEESVCASFGSEDPQINVAGHFKAKDAVSPGECPAAVCGNGEVELGEDCDDGNLVEDDGCMATCEVGECIGEDFESTFAAIQERVFEDSSCATELCHGGDPGAGKLMLTSDVAYAELIDAEADGSSYLRVDPGKPRESALYLKLWKKVDPDNASPIAGSGMPVFSDPLTPDLLEAVRLWIETGAPETGTVAGTESLLGGCFEEPEPISVKPLEEPPASEGVQIAMPPYPLPPESESEVCFAVYYDFTDTVPPEFVSSDGESVFVKSDDFRFDPHSHHLVLMSSGFGADQVNHPKFGAWTCVGGDRDGASCDPVDLDSCGDGICRSAIQNSVACIGYGPPGAPIAGSDNDLVGPPVVGDGFYRRIPLKGIAYWNSHAFNLTSKSHDIRAWRNLYFATERTFETQTIVDSTQIYLATGTPPFQKRTVCDSTPVPFGAHVIALTSHTHHRGEAFWMEYPVGNRIYENFTYADPAFEIFDPPLLFDQPNASQREIKYCAIFNNGVKPDGSPDPSKVRRRSTTPDNAPPCNPVACTDGKLGSACGGPNDHATCDSVPGAGDGFCDACAITAGVSTEDEMFIPIKTLYMDPSN